MKAGLYIAKRIDVAKLSGVSEATVSRIFNICKTTSRRNKNT